MICCNRKEKEIPLGCVFFQCFGTNTPHPETWHMLSDWKQRGKYMWVKSEGRFKTRRVMLAVDYTDASFKG